MLPRRTAGRFAAEQLDVIAVQRGHPHVSLDVVVANWRPGVALAWFALEVAVDESPDDAATVNGFLRTRLL